MSPEEGKTLLAAAKRHQQDPESRSYFLGSTKTHTASRAVVEKSYLLLTPAEACKTFGRKIRQKDPALRQVEVQDVDGTCERCYVFKHPEAVGRRLVVQQEMGEIDETVLMDPDSHHHMEQGAQLRRSAPEEETV